MSGFGTDAIPGMIAGKPTIPQWKPVTLGDSQTQAIIQNTASLPGIQSLAGSVNSFNLSQLQTALQTMIPGYNDLTKGVTGNIDSLLKGEIPKDVSDQIQSSDAAKSLTGGYGGSGMSHNLVARDLGLTSLDLIGKGMSSAQSWIATMGQLTQPNLFNLSSMFVTPQQQFDATFQNQTAQFQRDYISNMNDYQHSFRKLLADDVQGTAQTLLSMYGGMMMGGGGGGMSSMMGGMGGGGGGTNGMNAQSFMGGSAEGSTVGG